MTTPQTPDNEAATAQEPSAPPSQRSSETASETPNAGVRWATEGIEQPWTLGEAIGQALSALRGNLGPLVGGYAPYVLLPVVLAAVAGGLAGTVFRSVFFEPSADLFHRSLSSSLAPSSSSGLAALATTLRATPAFVQLLIALGVIGFVFALVGLSQLYETALAAIRGVAVSPGRVGRAVRRTPKLVVIQLLILLLAIVPTTFGFLAMPFVIAPFFVVDDNASIGTALRKSWRVSKHFIGTLWLLHFALLPLGVLGYGSQLFAVLTVPLQICAIAYVYVRATGRNDLAWLTPEYGSRSIRTFLKVTLVALLTLFAGLVAWVESLPTLRGAAWSAKDMAVRVSTILTGVTAVIVLLALLLPYVLDRLEGNRFTSFVAARHVRSQKSGFLTVISVLSICGVAISSCALSSVVSVMGGFSQDLKRKILGNNAHIVIDMTAGTTFDDYESALERVRGVKGVVGAAPVVHGEVMASSASNLAGVIVSGIEPQSIKSVIELGNNIEVGKLDYLEHPEKLTHLPPNEVIGLGPGGEQYLKGADLGGLTDEIDPAVRAVLLDKPDRPGLILGRELAKTLHVYVGDEITLVSPLGDLGPMGVMPRTKKFRIAGIFYSGMYEYDATYVYTMIDAAQDYFQTAGKISAIEIKVDDAEHADRIAPEVIAALDRPELRVRDWREINKNLFSALKLERFATFIILSIAIMVASFCIVCTLLLMVTEKGKEIAILKAIGASDGTILRTFMIEGIIIGGIGTVFGVTTGLAVCTGLSWFGLRLDPDVYYIDRLPISVNGWDFLTVALAALTICTLSTIYPAYAASRLRPVDGLRYE